MNPSHPTRADYSVLQFSLATGTDGNAMQKTKTCGAFESIEAAFASARLLALQEASRLSRLATDLTRAKIEVRDTEWGYDVRNGSLTVTRLWVHDRSPEIPA
jgi:hypothetical protein